MRIFLAALLAVSCCRTETPAKGPTGSNAQAETLRVSSPSGFSCAAVSISPRLAITALHCVNKLCKDTVGCGVSIEYSGGGEGQAQVVSTSEPDLLALLALEQPLKRHGVLYCDSPRERSVVATVGHPGGEGWVVSYGKVSQSTKVDWGKGEETLVLVAEIPTKPGSSGGGLFDNSDRLIGVQIARWSPWSKDFGKAAFVQSSQIYKMAGNYCLAKGSEACNGLRCISALYDIVSFDFRKK